LFSSILNGPVRQETARDRILRHGRRSVNRAAYYSGHCTFQVLPNSLAAKREERIEQGEVRNVLLAKAHPLPDNLNIGRERRIEMIPHILTLLAGAVVSALMLRKKGIEDSGAPWRPELEELGKTLTGHLAAYDSRFAELETAIQALRSEPGAVPDTRVDELAARLAELQPRLEAIGAELAAKPDSRIDTLTARLAEFQPRMEAIAAELAGKSAARIDGLSARLEAVEAGQCKVTELEQKVHAHEQRLNATTQVVIGIEQMLTARIAEFDERLEAQARSLQAMNSSIAQSDELIERVLDLVNNPPAASEPAGTAALSGPYQDLRM
jgi:hypothetical protein